MSFIKPITIYERGEIKVYINQCHSGGRKTKVFAVRRNDKTGRSALLGLIVFDPGWRQYVLLPEKDTKWCGSCMNEISKFTINQTNKWKKMRVTPS